MSYKENGNTKSAVGFWGNVDGCLPLDDTTNIPLWLLSSSHTEATQITQGTKLTVLGFDASYNWEKIILISIMENFFGAIANDDIIVYVGDKYVLSVNTIEDYFNDASLKDLVIKSPTTDAQERFDSAYHYYMAIKATSKEEMIVAQTTNLGLCKLNIIVGDNLPKKVCALRNGMFISDVLDGLKRFSDFKDFVAVFQCDNDAGNRLLRNMEPPRHDKFSPERLLEKTEIVKGQKALKEIANWIRGVLKDKARDPVSDKTLLNELKDLLGDDEFDDSNQKGEEINPLGKLVYQGKPVKIIAHKFVPPVEEYQGDIVWPTEGEGNDIGIDESNVLSEGKGKNGGKSSSGDDSDATVASNVGRLVEINNIRAPIIDDGRKRNLTFMPSASGKISIRIYESGADSDYSVNIVGSNIGVVRNGCLILECIASQKVAVIVELGEIFLGAIKVIANEI